MQKEKNDFVFTDEKQKMDPILIHQFLTNESYWSKGITLEKVKRSMEHSLCFGIFYNNEQIGFARVITDYVRMAYLADVFILPAFRGKGLGKWMMENILVYPDFSEIKKWLLGTADAHGLYKQFGFTALAHPERFMEKVD